MGWAWSWGAIEDEIVQRSILLPEALFRFSGRSRQLYLTMPIQRSAHLNSSIIRPVITTVLTTMSLSRTVNM